MAKTDKHQHFKDAFSKRKPDFEQLRTICFGLIQNALKKNGIDCLSIESRVKSDESAFEKSKSNKYDDPILEITDFVALRVIVFLDRDIDAAANALRSLFQVDPENSVDKRLPEKVDTVGYRSLHLVCSLGDVRSHLPEYNDLDGFPFEIQIRTALQHAWAEIEHKRNYKGAATLPKGLQHRLMALSGTLELVDREFSAIATEAETYANLLKDKSVTDKDQDALSEIALAAVFDGLIDSEGLSSHFVKAGTSKNEATQTSLLSELTHFGIKTVGDLKNLIGRINVAGIVKMRKGAYTKTRAADFFRIAMILDNIDIYFESEYRIQWPYMDDDEFKFLEAELGRDDLESFLQRFGIAVVPF
jgi:ppGpp synthetase/RelA/SpoT-type nucleotidyltranferase